MNEEEAAIAELKSMAKDDLLKVDHTVLKWYCQALDCNRATKIKDFGLKFEYFTRWGWLDLRFNVFLCGKHWPLRNTEFPKKKGSGSNHIIQ